MLYIESRYAREKRLNTRQKIQRMLVIARYSLPNKSRTINLGKMIVENNAPAMRIKTSTSDLFKICLLSFPDACNAVALGNMTVVIASDAKTTIVPMREAEA